MAGDRQTAVTVSRDNAAIGKTSFKCTRPRRRGRGEWRGWGALLSTSKGFVSIGRTWVLSAETGYDEPRDSTLLSALRNRDHRRHAEPAAQLQQYGRCAGMLPARRVGRPLWLVVHQRLRGGSRLVGGNPNATSAARATRRAGHAQGKYVMRMER